MCRMVVQKSNFYWLLSMIKVCTRKPLVILLVEGGGGGGSGGGGGVCVLVDGCASDHRWRPRARGYGSKSAAFSACLTPRHHQHTHSHGTTAHTTSYYHTQPPHTTTTHHTVSRDTAHTTSYYTPPHTTTNNSNILPFLFLSLPFPLWYHLVEGLTTPSYGLGTFCPLDTFPV